MNPDNEKEPRSDAVEDIPQPVPAPPPAPVSDNVRPTPAERPDGSSKSFREWLRKWVEPDGIVAIATVLALFVIAWQACLTRETLEITKKATMDSDASTREALSVAKRAADAAIESNKLTQQQLELNKTLGRARVLIQEVDAFALENMATATIRVTNVSHAGAQELALRTYRELGQKTERPCVWMFAQPYPLRALGGQQTTRFTSTELEITEAMARQIHDGKAKLFLWISLTYGDPLGRGSDSACYVWVSQFHEPYWHRCEWQHFKDPKDPGNYDAAAHVCK